MSKELSLSGPWRLKVFGKVPEYLNEQISLNNRVFKGNVPGTIHTDLMAEGIIPDPFYRDNEARVRWIEDVDWEYAKEFELSEEDLSYPVIYLTFAGIDTVADVFLNGKRILQSRNMFVPYRVKINKLVHVGMNLLRVIVRSPKKFAIRQERVHGKIFAELDTYRVHIRKAQYSFGWDWGPRLVASGIWRNVTIEFFKDVSIEEVRLSTLRINRENVEASLIGKFLLVPQSEKSVRMVHLIVSDDKISREFNFPFRLSIKKKIKLEGIEPWYTHDIGEPKLYNIRIEVIGADGQVLESKQFKTGFRTVRIIREKDGIGESFIFEINGKRLFVKGANWVPADSFLPRVRSSDYASFVRAAREANMNMLRVWGGGIYEDEEFYRACDENGLLVWQDFMFACASYPEYKGFVDEVEREAIYNVRRISNHPCIAIFCGNNEAEWVWQRTMGKSIEEMPGAFLFKDRLRDIVRREAPRIFYWRSSPFGGKLPNDETAGDHHQWDVWSGFKSPSEYKKNTARFVSEFGFQSPPSLATINRFTAPEDRDLQSSVMRLHNKQIEGTERLFRFAAGELKLSKKFENLVLQMQLIQAKAIKTGVDHWRKRKWRTAGTIFWQLNDCWPVSSWSAIDYYKRPKALYYWAKGFFKPIKLIIENDGGHVVIYLLNDTLEAIRAKLDVFVMDIEGSVLRSFSEDVITQKNSVASVKKFSASGFPSERTFIYATVSDIDTGSLIDDEDYILTPWLDFAFESPNIEVDVSVEASYRLIRLKSDKFVQGVYLALDERIGELSDNFVTLLPKREKVIKYSGPKSLNRIKLKYPLLCDD
jgi:beta-mannosidase